VVIPLTPTLSPQAGEGVPLPTRESLQPNQAEL
jgi:hypothetical protein